MPARYMALNPIRTITPPHDHVAPQPLLFSSPTLFFLSLTQFLSLISITYAVVFYVFCLSQEPVDTFI